ncbi:MAG TPA: AAA family ATPase [Kribbella sp.]|uniref:helix-turn-helix transcriptional regulator n=1 Tax=Kribbella sp. TaxID=1871183 RepID=UPI002D785353|nr:AAA family ATPase [Kribbella sp.]HET6295304.1 AAA family ATPase [Kribbella sp.]
MGGATIARSPGIVGRIVERGILGAAIRGAVEGRPGAVFVHGEAGVGKTRLVRTVCDEAALRGVAIVWGRCVRFGAVDAPYGPLIGALEGWVESAEPAELSDVLELVPAAGALLPSLGNHTSARAVRLLPVVDGLVMAIASHRPTVLVVDDVQWADMASRDALAYLVAGFRSQRLTVFTTYRDEELGEGDPMHSWLADLRRLPSVTDIRLDRLTRDQTERQLAMLLGGDPHHQLVDDVARRSGGNPYLSELLVHGVTLADAELPAELPEELTGALLAAWHRLSAPTREVMRVLAVAGRPVPVDDLREVTGARAIGPERLSASLAEAAKAGIFVAQDPDLCWFRHPLLAEVLSASYVPGEAGPVHTAWAKTLEARSAAGLDEVRRVGDLAQHYEGAQDLEACLDASLRAADLARQITAPREEAAHLRRAARLWPEVHRGDADVLSNEVDLLERAARANELVGDGEASFAAWSRALALIDERAEPLRASRILLRWSESAWTTGRLKTEPIAEAQHAVELCRVFPESQQYAEALAFLSQSQAWSNALDAARENAEEAVLAAHRSGSCEALSAAYQARGFAYQRDERSEFDTTESMRFARLSGDPEQISWSCVARMNFLLERGRVAECIEVAAAGFNEALDAGASSPAAALGGAVAGGLLMFGRLSDSADVIRTGLSLACLPNARAHVRLQAARLAVRQGHLETASMHLQRTQELIPAYAERPGMEAPPVVAEYLLARGRPEEALAMLSRTLTAQFADPQIADEMLMWGARAAADLAVSARDSRDSALGKKAQTALDELVALREPLLPSPFAVTVPDDPIQPAMKALYVAERARLKAGKPTSAAWENAVHMCAAAGMRWEEAVSSWRWAQALLEEGARRTAIAMPLRSAHRFAVEVGAIPLQSQTEALATLCGKIPLEEPAAPSHDQAPLPFRSLTKREQEVLTSLIAGRTYAEIAGALFISEKTVSAHVSNLLRKTGTSSRGEVSALALRLGVHH